MAKSVPQDAKKPCLRGYFPGASMFDSYTKETVVLSIGKNRTMTVEGINGGTVWIGTLKFSCSVVVKRGEEELEKFNCVLLAGLENRSAYYDAEGIMYDLGHGVQTHAHQKAGDVINPPTITWIVEIPPPLVAVTKHPYKAIKK